MLRLGLCCLFHEAPIKFRTTTARHLATLKEGERERKISSLCLSNALALQQAILFCHHNKIGAFRVNSRILPLKTHPDMGYSVSELPEGNQIIRSFKDCGFNAKKHNIRLTFHPDQFTLLSSPDPAITARSLDELNYQCQVAGWIGADVINIHGGGAYGDKNQALQRVERNINALDKDLRKLLTIENDDRVYTPVDLLPLCLRTGVPLVYDLHHHRCLPDNLSAEEATAAALRTWNREPLFHLSSPKDGWNSGQPHKHHDYIDTNDFPEFWRELDLTVEIEAKAKELAVIRLYNELKF